MTWLPLALFTAALSSLVSITDKIVVERYLRDVWSFPFFTAAFLGMYTTALLLVRGYLGLFRLPPLGILGIALLPGLMHYLGSLFYTRALQRTDASTVSTLNQTVPLYALVWGSIFFGNVFQPINYLGILVIVISCAVLGMEQANGGKRLQISHAVWLILAGALFRSLSDLFIKVTLSDQDYWNTFGLSRAVLLPISIVTLLHPGSRKHILGSLRINGLRMIPGVAALELFAIVPQILAVIAYDSGPLALVSTLLYCTPFFVLVSTRLLNILRPGLVPVKAGAQSFWRQLALIAGVLVGVIMLRL